MEHWKSIKDPKWSDRYMISDQGRVKRVAFVGTQMWSNRFSDRREVIHTFGERIVKPRTTKNNPHLFVSLERRDNGNLKRKTLYVHKAMAEAFVPNPDRLKRATVIDGDWTNLVPSNIRWISQSELSTTMMENHPELRNRLAEHNKAKKLLSDWEIAKIKESRANGITYRKLAALYEVSVSTIHKYSK